MCAQKLDLDERRRIEAWAKAFPPDENDCTNRFSILFISSNSVVITFLKSCISSSKKKKENVESI